MLSRSVVLTGVGLLLGAGLVHSAVRQAPTYDIRVMQIHAPGSQEYTIRLMNYGHAIVGPAKIVIQDAWPAGLTVTGGSGDTTGGVYWTMSPGAGTVGPQQLVLTFTMPAGVNAPGGGLRFAQFTITGHQNPVSNCVKLVVLFLNEVKASAGPAPYPEACVQ